MKSLLEREIKLAPPQDLDLASLGGERAGARTLGATYYDTDGGDVVAAFDELEVELVDGGEEDLRRLRAFSRAPAPTCSIPSSAEDVRTELLGLGRTLGDVRDQDVLIERLRNEAEGLDEVDREQARRAEARAAWPDAWRLLDRRAKALGA